MRSPTRRGKDQVTPVSAYSPPPRAGTGPSGNTTRCPTRCCTNLVSTKPRTRSIIITGRPRKTAPRTSGLSTISRSLCICPRSTSSSSAKWAKTPRRFGFHICPPNSSRTKPRTTSWPKKNRLSRTTPSPTSKCS